MMLKQKIFNYWLIVLICILLGGCDLLSGGTSIVLSSNKLGLTILGPSSKLTVTITSANSNDQSVTWESSNSSIATVDNFGVVSPVALGEATITAITNLSKKSADCYVTVSPPGVNWTKSSLPRNTSFASVAYGEGVFIAVADGILNTTSNCFEQNNVALYSPDGINWSEKILPEITGWSSITYGNGKFVAVGIGSSAYSEDGITWYASTLPKVVNWRAITYGAGIFVAISTDTNAAYSTDGRTWTISTLPDSGGYSITYGAGVFVAIIIDSNNGSTIAAYSADGKIWTRSILPAGIRWRSLSYGNGVFVAVGIGISNSNGANNISAYSRDGKTWSSKNLPASANWISVASDSTGFVAAALGDIAAYSADGETWTATTLPAHINWNCVSFGGGKYVVLGENTIAHSP
jgi:hypothetical protein